MKKTMIIALLLTILLLQMFSVACAWETERPGGCIPIKEYTESAETNNEASVGLRAGINYYMEDFSGSDDTVKLNVSMTANSRTGISYSLVDYLPCFWYEVSDMKWDNAGDEEVIYINMSQHNRFRFRFYGGWGSAMYEEVWVSTNGFISFQELSGAYPSPSDIPYSGEPNAIIAALWTDLVIDEESSIIAGIYLDIVTKFVVTWSNAKLKGTSKRLTFQIVLYEITEDPHVGQQCTIDINYKDVESITTDFAAGIENQDGSKGKGGLRSGSSLEYFNGKKHKYQPSSKQFYLKSLEIHLKDMNPNTEIYIKDEDGLAGGYNVKLKSSTPQPDPNFTFEDVLANWVVLLIHKAGMIVGELFVVGQTVRVLAGVQYVNTDHETPGEGTSDAYMRAPVCDPHSRPEGLVDATLSTVVYWVLKTPNDGDAHELTITATAEYYEYDYETGSKIIDTIPASVNLKVGPDNHNSLATARVINPETTYSRLYIGGYDTADYYQVYVDRGYRINVHAEATLEPYEPFFYLYIYDPGGTPRAIVGPDKSLSLSCVTNSEGYWFIGVLIYGAHGFYSLEVNLELNQLPAIPSIPEGDSSGYRNTSYAYRTSTNDPEGDKVRYQFDWGDDTYTTTDWHSSGAEASESHSWGSLGTYQVRVKAQDPSEIWGDWSDPLEVNIINIPPNTPSTPSGPVTVYRNVWYTYSTSPTQDPDEDRIRYHLNVTGPGNPYENTTIWVDSGTPMSWNLLWEPTDSLGTYLIQTWVEDKPGALSPMSSLSVDLVNSPPGTPSAPSGEIDGYRNTSYNYSTSTTDPDGNLVCYEFRWDDSSITMTGWCTSGSTVSESHSWSEPGTYDVEVRAQDSIGAWSNSSPTLQVNIANRPPDTPSTPSGTTPGHVYTTYDYSTSTDDPEEDDVQYEFSWDDGASNTFTDWYTPGELASASHSWSRPGTYEIQTRAEDGYDEHSGWSSPKTVTITQNDASTGEDSVSFSSAPIINTDTIYKGTLYETGPVDLYDFYQFYAASGKQIDATMWPPSGVDFDLTLYNPSGMPRDTSQRGAGYTESVHYEADVSGYWRIGIIIHSRTEVDEGQCSFLVNVYTDPGGGGCPILYVYDGEQYACEGLLDIHNPDGIDIVTNHTLVTTPKRVRGTYRLRLTEHPQTISHIDQVKLYAILADETLVELPLIWAWHSEDGYVRPQLRFSDDWKTDTLGANHNNGTSQSIYLRFLAPPPNIEVIGFLFVIEGNNPWWKE